MKVISFYLLLIFSIVFLTSCENDNELKSEEVELVIGHWVSPVYIDSLVHYTRATALKEDDFGISFNLGNSLVERQNAGFCGTPPISYANYNGTWSKTGDLINIKVDFWGGKATLLWKVVAVDAKTLSIYPIKSEYIYKE